MVDYFLLFDEPRRPWLDLEQLRAKYLAHSSDAHPDRIHNASEEIKHRANQRFAEINAAYNCLREPKDRLHHLLELELGTKLKDVERVPGNLVDLFFEIAQSLRQTDKFIATIPKASSALLKVQWAEKGIEHLEQLNIHQQSIDSLRRQMLDELKAMNCQWEKASTMEPAERKGSLPLERTEQICRAFGYFDRWSQQIQTRILNLSI